jgi:crotonobetaine/carnitine-CoA ligase
MPEHAASIAPGMAAVLPRTLPAMLLGQAERFGDRPFLTIAGARWSHRDASAAAARCGAALRRAGVERGDRVAVLSSNRVELLEVVLGCGWIGAAAVPINTASMGPQIEYILADSGARLLVIEAGLVERLALADLGRTALQSIWIVGTKASGAGVALPLPSRPFPTDADSTAPADVLPGETLAILYTSGTTGPANGVICPHAQFHAWGENSARILGVTADDVLCTTLPLFHINALNCYAQAALGGAGVVFEARFSASGFWPAMHAAEATVIYLLGAMVPILLAQPEGEAERTHRVRIGLGPGVPAAAGRAFRARTGVALVEGYGSTETNFVIATPADAPCDGRMGWLQPGFDARVVDEHDASLPDGQAGELVLRADAPFAFSGGYFNRPADTAHAWRGGWFHTGDRVVREADGAFRFVDRLKDSIRRRGENISSYEVEQALLEHPAVAAAAVYPVRSDLGEDEVMAALVARPGEAIDPAVVARHCESRLPRFAIPRYIDVVADLPRTENGKVQKFRLRERGVGAGTWDRGGGRPAAPRSETDEAALARRAAFD